MVRQKLNATPSIRRLPSYLHIIREAKIEGLDFISGTVIATELNLEPIQVRKDLAITGIVGRPKKGYPIEALIAAIERFLCWDSTRDAILVGAGNLGSALIGHEEFKSHGLNVIAAFDTDKSKIGKNVHGIPIFPFSSLSTKLEASRSKTAILTVPSSHAQSVADALVSAGINAIWNFTNVKLKVPERVIVQNEDLSSGYALLCVMTKIMEKSAQKPEEAADRSS
jgi:redox-sensing transcriptional repressor